MSVKFHIVLEKQDEGGYTVYIPELPGCVSQGETEKEAVKNIKEAIELYLEELEASKLAQTLAKVKVIEPLSSL
jgi:predicted RNase H-like HicB family nuclease